MKITAASAKKTADIIAKRLQALNARIESCQGAESPQVIQMVSKAQTEIETLQEVLDSLRGNSVSLNCF